MGSHPKKNYFKDLSLPDEKLVRKLARLWFMGEQLHVMVSRAEPDKVVSNDNNTTYLVNRGWVQPVGKPYVLGTGTFQPMEVSFKGLVVVEYFLRRRRLTHPKHRGKAGRPGRTACMKAKRPQPQGELHVTKDHDDNRSGQRAGI